MLSKEEYKILYYVTRIGADSLKRLKSCVKLSKEKILKNIDKLEKLNLIKKNFWRGGLYGFIVTSKGEKTLIKKEYAKWYNKLGD